MANFTDKMKELHRQNFNPASIVQFQNLINYIDTLLIQVSKTSDSDKKIELLVSNFIKFREHLSNLVNEFRLKNEMFERSLQVTNEYVVRFEEIKKKEEPLTDQNLPPEKESVKDL